MISKSVIFLLGIVIALAAFSPAYEENKVANVETEAARVERSASPGKKKAMKKVKKNRKNKSRKSKKGKMNRKSLKNKNNKKRRGNKKGKTSRKSKKNNRKKDVTVPIPLSPLQTGDCLKTAVKAMRRWKDLVSNFNKQNKRVSKQISIARNKESKKQDFNPVAEKLAELGGGNLSALTCAGSSETNEAENLKNLTTELFACEGEIDFKCNPANFAAPNATFIAECESAVERFENETRKCQALSLDATDDDACACWSSSNYSAVFEAVANCKITVAGEVSKELSDCRETFSNCRKLEDDAIDVYSSCSKCEPGTTTAATELVTTTATGDGSTTAGHDEREGACFVGNKCGSCSCCLGPCVGVPIIGDVCVGGCIGFFGNADDENSKALNGPLYGIVSAPNDVDNTSCIVGGSCGLCECCNGQCATHAGNDICVGECFNIDGEIQYSREKPDGDEILPSTGGDSCAVGHQCGPCDCCTGGFCISGECFGACANTDGQVLSFNAVLAPGDVRDSATTTTTSVGSTQATVVGAACESCLVCIGPCAFGQCMGVCVGLNRRLHYVYSPEAEAAFSATTFTINNRRNAKMDYSVSATISDLSGHVDANGVSSQSIFFASLITKVRATQASDSNIVCSDYTSSGTGYRTFAICDRGDGCFVCRPGTDGCCM